VEHCHWKVHFARIARESQLRCRPKDRNERHMTKRARKDVEAAKLLQQILVDAEGDDAQLWALADFIGAGSGDRPVT